MKTENKTPLQKTIDKFLELKEKSSTLRDVIYLDGVITVLESFLQNEKDFANDVFEKGIEHGKEGVVGVNKTYNDFEDYYKQTFKQ